MKRSALFVLVPILLLLTALISPSAVADPGVLFEGGSDNIYIPEDIGNDGLIVGNAQSVKGGGYFAWAWRPGGPLAMIGFPGPAGYISPTWHVEDVNDSGQTVGLYRWWDAGLERAIWTAFLWEEGGGTTLLPYPDGMNQCEATRINNAGQVVGQCCDAYSPDPALTAYLWNPDGEIVSLGTLGGTRSEAVDINESGQVLGWSLREGMYARSCFLWSPGEGMVDLGDLMGGYCSPLDLNDLGQVTAVSAMEAMGTQGVIWDAEKGMRWIDPGDDTGSFYPYIINNSGEVAGVLYAPSYNPDAARWNEKEGLVRLTSHEDMMAAVAMNEAGIILIEDRGKAGSLVWTAEKGLKPLHSPGWMATVPFAVNDNGQAVGSFVRYWNRKPAEHGMVVWEIK